MSTLPEQSMSVPHRRDTVIMGRLDFASLLLRLIGTELYKIRRRAMSKVLVSIGFSIVVLVFLIISLGSFAVLSSPLESFAPPRCSPSTPAGVQCLNRAATQEELEQAKQANLKGFSEPLRLPGSFTVATQTINTLGLILIIILAGTIVGGEYSVGTIRLMFTRGPTRTQFLLAKIGAILVCIVLGVFISILVGVVSGTLLNLFLGVPSDFSFLNGNWLFHSFLKFLIVSLNLFMYAIIALFLANLGRATAAGVAGALVWWVLENALSGVLVLVSSFNRGPVGDFLRSIPDYFISNNTSALLQNQDNYLGDGSPAQIGDLHALLVLAIYLVVLIGFTWWTNERRDITN